MIEKVKQLAKEYGATKVSHFGKWFEYDVYLPYFGKNYPAIGLPIVFLAKDDEVRTATEKEYKDILSKEE